jgi:hypothetical protein
MEDGSLSYRAATFVGVDGMAYALVWLQKVMSKAVLVFSTGVGHAREATENLLVLEKLRTADPRCMWRDLA